MSFSSFTRCPKHSSFANHKHAFENYLKPSLLQLKRERAAGPLDLMRAFREVVSPSPGSIMKLARFGRRLPAITCGVILLVGMGCEAKPVPLNGDVFIVTKGGQNYKLGLVEVAAFPDSALRDAIEQRVARAKEMLPTLEAQRDSLDKRHDEIDAIREKAFNSYLANILSRSHQERYELAQSRSTAALRELLAKSQEIDSLADGGTRCKTCYSGISLPAR